MPRTPAPRHSASNAATESDPGGQLRDMVGTWRDSKHSTYQVKRDADPSSCSVTTIRPDGRIIHSEGLLKVDNKNRRVLWSTNFYLDAQGERPASITWVPLMSRSRPFVWTRLGAASTLPPPTTLSNDDSSQKVSSAKSTQQAQSQSFSSSSWLTVEKERKQASGNETKVAWQTSSSSSRWQASDHADRHKTAWPEDQRGWKSEGSWWLKGEDSQDHVRSQEQERSDAAANLLQMLKGKHASGQTQDAKDKHKNSWPDLLSKKEKTAPPPPKPLPKESPEQVEIKESTRKAPPTASPEQVEATVIRNVEEWIGQLRASESKSIPNTEKHIEVEKEHPKQSKVSSNKVAPSYTNGSVDTEKDAPGPSCSDLKSLLSQEKTVDEALLERLKKLEEENASLKAIKATSETTQSALMFPGMAYAAPTWQMQMEAMKAYSYQTAGFWACSQQMQWVNPDQNWGQQMQMVIACTHNGPGIASHGTSKEVLKLCNPEQSQVISKEVSDARAGTGRKLLNCRVPRSPKNDEESDLFSPEDRDNCLKVLETALRKMAFLDIQRVANEQTRGSDTLTFYLRDLKGQDHSTLLEKVVDQLGMQLAILAATDSSSKADTVRIDDISVENGAVQLTVCSTLHLSLFFVLTKNLLVENEQAADCPDEVPVVKSSPSQPKREVPPPPAAPPVAPPAATLAAPPVAPPFPGPVTAAAAPLAAPPVAPPVAPAAPLVAPPAAPLAAPPAAPPAKAAPKLPPVSQAYEVGEPVSARFYGTWYDASVRRPFAGNVNGTALVEVLWDSDGTISVIPVTDVARRGSQLQGNHDKTENSGTENKEKIPAPPPPRLPEPAVVPEKAVPVISSTTVWETPIRPSPQRQSSPSRKPQEKKETLPVGEECREHTQTISKTYAGQVIFYNPAAGYGSIKSVSFAKEIWFGKQCLPDELHWREDLEGSSVTFRLEASEDGKLRAEDDSIQLCESTNQKALLKKQKIIPMAAPEVNATAPGKAQKRREARKQLSEALMDVLTKPDEHQNEESRQAQSLQTRKKKVLHQKTQPSNRRKLSQAQRKRRAMSPKTEDQEVDSPKGEDALDQQDQENKEVGPPCKLCERPACHPRDDDDDGMMAEEIGICGKHFRELETLQRKLSKWAMAAPDSDVNELHALASPDAEGLRAGVFKDLQKLKLLVDFLMVKGCDFDAEGIEFRTPLEETVNALRFAVKEVANLSEEVLTSKSKVVGSKKELEAAVEEAQGLRFVGQVLALHWKAGRGYAGEPYEAECELLAKDAATHIPWAEELIKEAEEIDSESCSEGESTADDN